MDRAKDMIIRGGENVYCVQVEAALFEHPAVADCAVIGIPEPTLGEEVGAVIVLRPGHKVTADELSRHVRERLAGFMVPTHMWFQDAPLPRNPAGKVLKRNFARRTGRAPSELNHTPSAVRYRWPWSGRAHADPKGPASANSMQERSKRPQVAQRLG